MNTVPLSNKDIDWLKSLIVSNQDGQREIILLHRYYINLLLLFLSEDVAKMINDYMNLCTIDVTCYQRSKIISIITTDFSFNIKKDTRHGISYATEIYLKHINFALCSFKYNPSFNDQTFSNTGFEYGYYKFNDIINEYVKSQYVSPMNNNLLIHRLPGNNNIIAFHTSINQYTLCKINNKDMFENMISCVKILHDILKN